MTASRTREDFFSFRELVAQNYRQARVELVLDNLNTHKDTGRGAFISAWNRRHGKRFVFHYTPTHGSWLNQVERRFAIVTRRVLRHAISVRWMSSSLARRVHPAVEHQGGSPIPLDLPRPAASKLSR